jgi:hypothetical protein
VSTPSTAHRATATATATASERERSRRMLAAGAAAAAVATTLAAILVGAQGAAQGLGPGIAPSAGKILKNLYGTPGTQVAGNVLRNIGLVLAASVGLFFYGAVRRRGVRAGRWVVVMIVLGTLIFCADFWVGYLIDHHVALRFHRAHLGGAAAERYAHHLLHTGAPHWVPLVDLFSRLCFGAWLIVIAYYGSVVGLLSQAMAIWCAGCGLAIPFLPGGDVIFLGWLLAVAALAYGWWPGGRPPAWETGRPIHQAR